MLARFTLMEPDHSPHYRIYRVQLHTSTTGGPKPPTTYTVQLQVQPDVPSVEQCTVIRVL